jgi:hypothetical protein
MFGTVKLARTGTSLAVFVTTVALALSVAGPASAATSSRAAGTSTALARAEAAAMSTYAGSTALTAKVVTAAKAHCYGKTNSSTQWFGHQMKLNSCYTTEIIGALTAGTGGAAIVAGILAITGVGAAVAGIVAGVLGVFLGAITVCSHNGNGIILDESWTGQVWCAGQ